MRLLVIIPCYNEGKAILPLLLSLKEQLKNVNYASDILVIDDGSQDDTYEQAAKETTVIRLPINLGIGPAVHCGIKYAHLQHYDLCVRVDGDGQHPASEMVKLIRAYEEEPANNIIIGSRFKQIEGFKSTFFRRIGIYILRWMLLLLTGKKVSDPTSGLILYDKTAIKKFSKDFPLDFPEPISIMHAQMHHLCLKEVAVKMQERATGTSSIYGFKKIYYMIFVCLNLLFLRSRKKI